MNFFKTILVVLIEQAKALKNFVLTKSDPVLLSFLLFILNYRISFKILAIAALYFFKPKIKFNRDGVTLFYFSMIFLSFFNLVFIHRDYSYQHVVTVLAGMLIWLCCLLTYYQIRFAVNNNQPFKITNTLKILTLINLAVTCYDYLKVVFITGTINPFTQISPPPYGVSSGDLIGGVFGDIHLVNTIISCFLVLFFMYRKCVGYSIASLLPFLLTGSNLGTLILFAVLLYVLVLKKGAIYKTIALSLMCGIVLFYLKITPDNKNYMLKVLTKAGEYFSKQQPKTYLANAPLISNNNDLKPKKVYTKDELVAMYISYLIKTKKITQKNAITKPDEGVIKKLTAYKLTNEKQNQKRSDYVFARKDSVARAKENNPLFEYGKLKKYNLDSVSGKIVSFKQTKNYLQSNWQVALFGAGVGSFSSRQAFINSGIVGDSRILTALPQYETREFKQNHKSIFKYLMYQDDETHSITNLPFCWYNQVFGEYGIIGFLSFAIFYFGFFIKKLPRLSYGKLLLICVFGFLFFDYWYERLSVMVLFELLMLIDLKSETEEEEETV